jgi:cytochrome c peroxidase
MNAFPQDSALLSSDPTAYACTHVDASGHPRVDPTSNVGGVNVRQVTARNAPTVINAVFNDRNFWDGRAQNDFNGASPFGAREQGARIWELGNGQLVTVTVSITNSSLASQAVGPPNNPVEMACHGPVLKPDKRAASAPKGGV